MALLMTNVASARSKCSVEGFARLCEDYGLHPRFEDGQTELTLSDKEMIDYGWRRASEPQEAALSC